MSRPAACRAAHLYVCPLWRLLRPCARRTGFPTCPSLWDGLPSPSWSG